MRKPGECTTMAEIRAGIDRLDEDLVRLFAERAAFIDRAAEIKAEVDLPARIEGRVEEVVGNVRRHAATYGLPPDLVEKLWRRLIDWSIAEANRVADMAPPAPGVAVLVPLVPRNPAGIHPEWFQTVPILCYHRFGPVATKMTITPQAFAQQLEHLAKNGWRVIPLAELRGFLDARKPLPPRTVVITMDDGYESVHRHAFPLLKKHGFPATLFVYTDFIGAPDALSWSQLQEMQRSGLVDVQSHSKSHRNLIERSAAETDARYRLAIDAEMRVPRELLARRIEGTTVQHIAWPFGDANATVLEAAARNGFELGATVMPGGNAFYAQPLMLRRTMIFGDMDLDAFRARLQTIRSWGSP